jgi:hypothetical protein
VGKARLLQESSLPAVWKHVAIAVVLLASEAVLGIGVIGMGVGMIAGIGALIAAVTEKNRRSYLLRVAALYVLLFVATTEFISFNWRLAKRRAVPVITAIRQFQSRQGHYPNALDELVPTYLPSIPKAGMTLVSREFGYEPSRPQIYFPVMFHGVSAFDFPTDTWTTNE